MTTPDGDRDDPAAGDEGQGGHSPAVRLIFSYDGDEVTLLQQQRVDVAVTGFDLDQPLGAGQHVVEVRTGEGEALTRVPVRGGPATSTEVFPEQPGAPIYRVEAPTSGAFTVVVPAPAAATQVALLRLDAADVAARAEGGQPEAGAVVGVDLGTFELEA